MRVMKSWIERSLTILSLSVAFVLSMPAAAVAQNPVNPSTAVFAASADHTVLDTGVPRLSSYEAQWYASTAPAGAPPVQVKDLGKPTPDATNQITLDLATLNRPITLGGTYVLTIVAKGPAGTSSSAPSNPFDLKGGLILPAAPGKPVVK